MNGQGVEQDYTEAVYWFRKAAEQGHPDAMFCLGCCYEDGTGVDQDMEKATELYRRAAKQKCMEAENKLRKIEKKETTGS